MSFLLDTNICSEHLKRPSGLVHRFIQHAGRLHISTIVLGELLQRGIEVDAVDLMIAASALVHDFTLVTHNTADFRPVPGLRLEDWLVS